MIGKGATPSFFAIANDNYTLTVFIICNFLYNIHVVLDLVRTFTYITPIYINLKYYIYIDNSHFKDYNKIRNK